MILTWVGVALLAGSWLLGLDYYLPAGPIGWIVVVAVGTALLSARIKECSSPLGEKAESNVQPQSGPHPGPLPKGEGEKLLALVLLLPAVWYAPWPYRAAPLLIVVGLLLELLVGRRWLQKRAVQWLGRGSLAAGVVLLAQIPVMAVYTWWTARSHDLPNPLPEILSGLARLQGADATAHVTADDSSVVIHTIRRIHRLAATYDLLLDPASVCFFVGALVVLGLLVWARLPAGQRASAWCGAAGRLSLVMAAWLPLRAAVLMALYVHRVLRCDYSWPLHAMNHFFSPWVLLFLLLGPVLLAWRFVRLPEAAPQRPEESPVKAAGPWRFVAATALVALGVAVFAVGAYWDPVGERKDGRVMVVERHSAWEPTIRTYNTKEYGEPSGYNYRVMYDLLAQFYDMSRVIMPEDLADDTDPEIKQDLEDNHKFCQLDDETLEECDVLIIKIPSIPEAGEEEGRKQSRRAAEQKKATDEKAKKVALSPRYSPKEVEAVQRFVKRGGGLLLVGDHTNFANSSTVMNDVVRPMGFTFRNDLLFGFGPSADEEHYEKPRLPHPAVQHLPPLDFAVSDSIDPGWSWGRSAMLGTSLWSMGPEYHHSNFMPHPRHCPEMRYGAFIQLWATRYGQGRVLAFTDSTQLSNFCILQPGKAEVVLGAVEWLNHTSPRDPGPWLLVLGWLPLGGGLWLARTRRGAWLVLAAAGACAWVLACLAVAAMQQSSMPVPQRRPDAEPRVEVVIDRTVSDVPLILGALPTAELTKCFGLLEEWIPRLGTPQLRYFTTRRSGPTAFAGDVLVVVYPTRPVTAEYREGLVQFVANGGKVLVVDSPENMQSTANDLLSPFGLKVLHLSQMEQWWQGTLTMVGRWPWLKIDLACEVSGGRSVADLGGRPVAAIAAYGERGGKVLAVGFGSTFNDINLGGDYSWMIEPDRDTRVRYEVLFSLLRLLVEDKPVAAPPPGELPEPKEGIREAEEPGR